jgi:hypothetical protein
MPQLQAERHASHDAPDFLYLGLSLGGEPLAVAPVLLFETKTHPNKSGRSTSVISMGKRLECRFVSRTVNAAPFTIPTTTAPILKHSTSVLPL